MHYAPDKTIYPEFPNSNNASVKYPGIFEITTKKKISKPSDIPNKFLYNPTHQLM